MKTKLCRPILVETEDKGHFKDLIINPKTGKLFQFQFQNCTENKQELILISLEDEKIEVGELVYKADAKPKIYRYVPTTNPWYKDEVKVIASQSQLSPEYIQQFIEEYNKGEVKDVKIEMVDNGYEVDMEGIGGCDVGWMSKLEPKLTNEFVTIIEKTPILYTEEEVYNLFNKYFIDQDGEYDLISFFNWFKQNKKK